MRYPPADYQPIHRNVIRTRRVFIRANGNAPWPCVRCKQLVYRIGRQSDDGNIHHKDHNELNDAPDNLEMLHSRCHGQEHHLGETHSPEHNAKVGRPARVFTGEWKAKLTAKQLTRVKCPLCTYVSSPQCVGRHKKVMHVSSD